MTLPRISIFGLGYVGAVSAGCFAERGHTVIGVDVSPAKVALLAAGKSPIMEIGLEELLSRHAKTARLTATTDTAAAIASTDLSLICVGTPSASDGSPDLSYVFRVCEQIGRALRHKTGHLVILRSTTLPGWPKILPPHPRARKRQNRRRRVPIRRPSRIPARRHRRPRFFPPA